MIPASCRRLTRPWLARRLRGASRDARVDGLAQ
jgi:hypothetical protein